MRKSILFIIAMAITSFAVSQENTLKKDKVNIETSTLSTKKLTKTNSVENFLMADTKKKKKYIKFSSSEFRLKNNIPSDFPKYNDTGNLHSDTGNYDVALKAWIRNNKTKYSEIKEIIKF